jgi:hypothetical protein
MELILFCNRKIRKICNQFINKKEGSMKSSTLITIVLAVCFLSLFLAGCAHQPVPPGSGVPGFWKGLLHGFIAPVSFIVSLFTDCRIYAFPNAGRWYDLGFMLGIGGFGGGIFGVVRNKRG